jgi:phosphohistidine phosphatase
MELYLIRHAEAISLGEQNIHVDADRPLTDKGGEQAKMVGAGLQRKGVTLQAILTSPLMRARQTAEGILKAWSGSAPEVQVIDQLTPGTRPRKLARVLKDLQKEQVALIGHEPDLSAWASWVIGSKKAQLALAKAGVAHIRCDGNPGKACGTLIELVTPEWLS